MTNNFKGLESLARYGSAGVAIACIAAICFIVFQFNGLVQDHIQKSTEAMYEMKAAVSENNTVIKENLELVRELKIYLIQLNGGRK